MTAPVPVAEPRDAEPAPERTRARAALATLSVDNRTDRHLEITYRLAAPHAPEVRVGHVPARERVEMAPVPGGEPLVLVAHDEHRARLVMPPRALPVDGHWVWRIHTYARFEPPDSAAPRP